MSNAPGGTKLKLIKILGRGSFCPRVSWSRRVVTVYLFLENIVTCLITHLNETETRECWNYIIVFRCSRRNSTVDFLNSRPRSNVMSWSFNYLVSALNEHVDNFYYCLIYIGKIFHIIFSAYLILIRSTFQGRLDKHPIIVWQFMIATWRQSLQEAAWINNTSKIC